MRLRETYELLPVRQHGEVALVSISSPMTEGDNATVMPPPSLAGPCPSKSTSPFVPNRDEVNALKERSVSATEIARKWIGTPYQHQASLKGVGCDCVGLIRGVWRELYGNEPMALPPYTPDWAEVGGHEILLRGLAQHLSPVTLCEARAGDVLVFRIKPGAVAKHAAILRHDFGDPRAQIIHAYWGHAVVASWLRPFWHKQALSAFRFPVLGSGV